MALTPSDPESAPSKEGLVELAKKAKHSGLVARRDVSAVAKSLRLSLDANRRRIEGLVAEGLLLPPLPARSHRSIWAVSMVKDEEANIEGVVEHLLQQV